MTILFSKVTPVGDELKYVEDAIASGKLSGNGKYSLMCEELLSKHYNTDVILVTSCTHALEMISILLDVGPDDEIIMPSFTFVSTANAFVLRGASISFVDVDSNGNIDLSKLEDMISTRTKAVVNVHYAGWSCEPNKLKEICDRRQVILIEDAAQSLGSYYEGKPLGVVGDLSAVSFHDTKNIAAGEGGALIVNNKEFLEKAYYLREKGTNRKQFHQGLVDKYTWVSVGSSYEMPELSAAFLYGQLKSMEKINFRRREIWDQYFNAFKQLDGIKVMVPIPGLVGNAHLFGLIFETNDIRNRYIQFMKERGIITPFHYIPLHSSPFFSEYIQGRHRELINTDKISSCLVRLPLHYSLSNSDVGKVIDCTFKFARGRL